MLRTAELKPFIVYIKPPMFEVLKETRHQVRQQTFLIYSYLNCNSEGLCEVNLRRDKLPIVHRWRVQRNDPSRQQDCKLKAPRNVLCSNCIELQEFLYGHWFDLELVNDDLAGCFESLVRAVRRLDQDAQWVPASWVQWRPEPGPGPGPGPVRGTLQDSNVELLWLPGRSCYTVLSGCCKCYSGWQDIW